MDALPMRLEPGADLRDALEAVLAANGSSAGHVVCGIGSLSAARLRFAGADHSFDLSGDMEILTLAGSLSLSGAHLHMSVADAEGKVIGGHVLRGCIVRTTAELLIALLPGWRFNRDRDDTTGYMELVARRC